MVEAGFPFEAGTNAEDPWFIKVQRIDARVFQGVLSVLMSVILIVPLGIPVGVEPFVLEVAVWIDSMEPGDKIWLTQHYSVGAVTDYGALYTSVILHILLKSGQLKAGDLDGDGVIDVPGGKDVNGDGIADGLKLVMVPFSVDGLILFEWQIQDRIWDYIPDNIVYGEDYILLPFMALSDAIYDKFADEGFASVYEADYGLPKKGIASKTWGELPVTKGFDGPADLTMNIGEDATISGRIWARFGKERIDHSPDKWTKQSQSGRDKPHAAAYPVQIWDSAAQAVAMPWYTAGIYSGFFNGVRNGGEYEIWLNNNKFIKNDPNLGPVPLNTGFGGQTLDAVNLGQTWTFLMMLVANIGFFFKRRSRGGA